MRMIIKIVHQKTIFMLSHSGILCYQYMLSYNNELDFYTSTLFFFFFKQNLIKRVKDIFSSLITLSTELQVRELELLVNLEGKSILSQHAFVNYNEAAIQVQKTKKRQISVASKDCKNKQQTNKEKNLEMFSIFLYDAKKGNKLFSV